MAWLSAKLADARNRLVKATRYFVTGSEEGASAVEYALLVALIAAVIVGVVQALGLKVQNQFTTINNDLP
jgi:pilus assembly protein Flp/PilA